MQYDKFGRPFTDTNELVGLLYKNPDLSLNNFFVSDPEEYNAAIKQQWAEFTPLRKYTEVEFIGVDEFDAAMQKEWFMPNEYKTFDIVRWVLDQCKTQEELQRVGEELLLYQERDMFDLLRYLKYMVDTMRKHKVLWGVGRGSSVASYVLFLMGVHRINSMYWDLNIDEFLR